jgi:heat shock protein HslJ
MRVFAIALSLLAAGALIAVDPALAAPRKTGDKKTEEKKVEEKKFPTDGVWTLHEINGKAAPGDPPTLMIDSNLRGAGFAGCNTYSAALYPVRGMRLAMGPTAMTKKACPADRMNLEKLFLNILRTGPNWDVNGSDMTIKSQAGAMKLRRGF